MIPTTVSGVRSSLTASTLVLCAGIPRSGSTWLYNAARLLLTKADGAQRVYGAWIEKYDARQTGRWHVVKVHEPNEALAWRAKFILTSRRDLRDIAASAWKRDWIADEASTLMFLDSVVAQHAFWKARAGFEMIYERMRREPIAELAAIAQALQLTLDAAAIAGVLRDIESLGHDESSDDQFNPANLMHKKHILDGRVGYHAETLPADLLCTINQRYADWLRANGYAGSVRGSVSSE